MKSKILCKFWITLTDFYLWSDISSGACQQVAVNISWADNFHFLCFCVTMLTYSRNVIYSEPDYTRCIDSTQLHVFWSITALVSNKRINVLWIYQGCFPILLCKLTKSTIENNSEWEVTMKFPPTSSLPEWFPSGSISVLTRTPLVLAVSASAPLTCVVLWQRQKIDSWTH